MGYQSRVFGIQVHKYLMVSKIWLTENQPSSKSRNLEGLLGDEEQLNLVGANVGAIPF